MKKRYWLRGGVIGTVIYGLFILAMYIYFFRMGGDESGFGGAIILVVAVYVSPIIIFLASSFGWIYGKIKKRRSSIPTI